MAYYPLHFVVSAIFAPMFIQVERWRQRCACMCGEVKEGYDSSLCVFSKVVQHSVDHQRIPCFPELQHAAGARRMRRDVPGRDRMRQACPRAWGQAWFPKEAEIWNQPTWSRPRKPERCRSPLRAPARVRHGATSRFPPMPVCVPVHAPPAQQGSFRP